MDKQITVIIPGAGEEAQARDASIGPGTTAADILRSANLDPDRWRLELQRDGGSVTLASGDNVHAQVKIKRRSSSGRRIWWSGRSQTVMRSQPLPGTRMKCQAEGYRPQKARSGIRARIRTEVRT